MPPQDGKRGPRSVRPAGRAERARGAPLSAGGLLSSQSGGSAQRGSLIGGLPREVVVLAPEVPICSRLLVDRTVELQVLAKRAWAQVEVLADQLEDPGAADVFGAERLDHQRHGARHADRVGDLHLDAVGETGRDDVLGYVAGGVGGRAVHLGRVLAGERAAAVASHAAVRVDDDLAPREAAVAHRTADHKPSGRVDEEVLDQLAMLVHVVGQHRLDDVLPEILLDQRLRALAVLRGDQQLLDLHRLAVDISDRHLRLAVRSQVGDELGFAHVGEALGELVRKRDRQRHQLLGLVGRVAEHHPLVTGAGEVERVVVPGVGARLVSEVDALSDIGRLLVDRIDHRAGVVVEPELGVGVADPLDRLRAMSWMST